MTEQTQPQTEQQTDPVRARLAANHGLLIECAQIRKQRAQLVDQVEKAPMLQKAGLVTQIAYASLEIESRLLQAVQNLSALAAGALIEAPKAEPETLTDEGATDGETVH